MCPDLNWSCNGKPLLEVTIVVKKAEKEKSKRKKVKDEIKEESNTEIKLKPKVSEFKKGLLKPFKWVI